MNKTQSLAGVIRQRLADIEARLEVGVRQDVIISELKADGYETTLQNFRNELWRARKWKEQRASAGSVPAHAAPQHKPATKQPAASENLDCAIQKTDEPEGSKTDQDDNLTKMEKYHQVTNPDAVEEKFRAYSSKPKRVSPLKK